MRIRTCFVPVRAAQGMRKRTVLPLGAQKPRLPLQPGRLVVSNRQNPAGTAVYKGLGLMCMDRRQIINKYANAENVQGFVFH